MNFAEAQQYLFSLGHESLSIKLGLLNIARLVDRLENPQKCAPAVQIAGTNGKGSTAAMLSSICQTANIRTGLYTSPHLASITERIRINGAQITEDQFAKLATVVREAADDLISHESIYPTFFEHITAIAFLAFRDAGVSLMILETGLGGRLDATSVAEAEIVAVMPVDFDHQEYLGTSLAEIAAEKAAIIRVGTKAVIAPQREEAQREIERQIVASNANARFINEADIETKNVDSSGRFTVAYKSRGGGELYDDLEIGLRGRHQMINAAVAIELSECVVELGWPVPRKAVAVGLKDTRHSGRLEMRAGRGGQPAVLFDGAHNSAGALALRSYLTEFVSSPPLTILFAAMSDKDLVQITNTLFPLARRIVLSEIPNSPRAAKINVLKPHALRHLDESCIAEASSPEEAWRKAQEVTAPEGIICVTGSLYLIGEIQSLLEHQK